MAPPEFYGEMLRRGAVPVLLIPQGYLMRTNTGEVQDLKVAAEITLRRPAGYRARIWGQENRPAVLWRTGARIKQ
jgi:hypothetical protein